MSLHDAQLLTLRVLKQVMEEKLDEKNVQLAIVTPTKSGDGRMSGKFRILKEDELRPLVEGIN